MPDKELMTEAFERLFWKINLQNEIIETLMLYFKPVDRLDFEKGPTKACIFGAMGYLFDLQYPTNLLTPELLRNGEIMLTGFDTQKVVIITDMGTRITNNTDVVKYLKKVNG